MSSDKSFRILGFDGLRAIAVLFVWLDHRADIHLGGAGVSLFFVLSGFLIVDIIRRQRERIESGASDVLNEWKLFATRRIYRIFPVYYLFLLTIGLLLFFKFGHLNTKEFMMYILYMANIWISLYSHQWNIFSTHLWSLAVEEQFYLFFPIIALLVPSKRLYLVCAFIVFVGVILGHSIEFEYQEAANQLFFSFSKIALGGLCVLLLKPRRPEHGNNSLIPLSFITAYIFLSAIGLVVTGGNFYSEIIQPFPATVCVYFLLRYIYLNQSSLFVRVLEWHPVKKFGQLSYGFYIFHYPINAKFILLLTGVDVWSIPHFGHFIRPLEFLIPLLLAMASWKYIEQPVMRMRPALKGGPHELPQHRKQQ